ncbi:Uncharacterised protein [Mycobacteroides abscessus subsp. abscessus]|nr:Uncharacterised protein [Mycobacteroides abscessus subsp. abscessus]
MGTPARTAISSQVSDSKPTSVSRSRAVASIAENFRLLRSCVGRLRGTRGSVLIGSINSVRSAPVGHTDRSRLSLATCPVARTLYCASSMVPWSTRNVDLITPVTVLPYSFFSPNAPHSVITDLSGSDSRGNVRPSASANLASFSGLSGEIPTTAIPCPSSSARLSRKSHACLVQPGVDAAG